MISRPSDEIIRACIERSIRDNFYMSLLFGADVVSAPADVVSAPQIKAIETKPADWKHTGY